MILSQMEDYSIFSARGKISIFVQKYFCEMKNSKLNLDLRVIRPWLPAWNISAL